MMPKIAEKEMLNPIIDQGLAFKSQKATKVVCKPAK